MWGAWMGKGGRVRRRGPKDRGREQWRESEELVSVVEFKVAGALIWGIPGGS